MKKIKIGQIGIGHNHGEAKMLAVRKFPELFEIVGFSEDNEEWIAMREKYYSSHAPEYKTIYEEDKEWEENGNLES